MMTTTAEGKAIRVLRLVIGLPLALVASAAIGAVVLGILIGLPSDFVPTVQTHFLVSVPFAVVVGVPIFVLLKATRIGLSYVACCVAGIAIAAIPLAFLLVPEIARPGGLTEGSTGQMLGYAIAVIASGAAGGLAFCWIAEFLKIRS